MCLIDSAAGLFVAQGVKEADALGGREHEIEARNRGKPLRLDAPLVGERVDALDRDQAGLGLAACAQLLLGVGMQAADQPAEFALLHDALEFERSSASA